MVDAWGGHAVLIHGIWFREVFRWLFQTRKDGSAACTSAPARFCAFG